MATKKAKTKVVKNKTATTQKAVPKASAKKSKKDWQAPRGTQDTLPQDQKYWEYVVEMGKAVMHGFGWQRVDTPCFEDRGLIERSVGDDTDIVNKELFELKKRGDAQYVLRPEGTAPLVRAYIEHGMKSWPKPIKLFTVGPYFRYERPQKGRFRQFHQLDLEVFSSAAPVSDVQVIYVIHVLFQQLGLEDYTVKINSLGTPKERKEYIKILKDHYRRHKAKMSRWAADKLKTNPLRVLDSKEEKDLQLANTAPKLLDHLSDDSKKHFEEVQRLLSELEVPYEIDSSLVRGLDYYTHTVFEFMPKLSEGQQDSLAGGGRYDGLVKALGGKDTPAIGAAIGIERVIDQIKEEGIALSLDDKPQVFIVHLGDEAKVSALQLTRELQESGVRFSEGLNRDGMQSQLKLADRLGVLWAIILGHKEVLDETVILRSMESGMQEVIPREKLVDELKDRLGLE